MREEGRKATSNVAGGESITQEEEEGKGGEGSGEEGFGRSRLKGTRKNAHVFFWSDPAENNK